jgi:hypothetical protein
VFSQDSNIDDMGGKCYHRRPVWPECGPFNNTADSNLYSREPSACTEATGGKCTLAGKGCCNPGFPRGSRDLVAAGPWSAVLRRWDSEQLLLDARLAGGSPVRTL